MLRNRIENSLSSKSVPYACLICKTQRGKVAYTQLCRKCIRDHIHNTCYYRL